MSHTITQLPAPTYYLGKATSFPIWDNHPNPLAADPAYIAAAWECGFGNKDFLTRSECVAIRAKKGLRLPRWLMKDPARRLERGKYFCPEIITCTHTNTIAFQNGVEVDPAAVAATENITNG
jgi:hypothetical protein